MTKLEDEIIRWGKLLFERRLISGWGGNLSCRFGKNEFLITGQHAPLGFLARKIWCASTADGKPIRKISTHPARRRCIWRSMRGTDAQAIVHVHPPMVLAFSLAHESFVPVSFEEKYTIGEVPIIPQDTPTVTQPEKVVEELKYHPVVIIKGHGTVAIGKRFPGSISYSPTCLKKRCIASFSKNGWAARLDGSKRCRCAIIGGAKRHTLRAILARTYAALVDSANQDAQFRAAWQPRPVLSTSLTCHMEESETAWTVKFHRWGNLGAAIRGMTVNF